MTQPADQATSNPKFLFHPIIPPVKKEQSLYTISTGVDKNRKILKSVREIIQKNIDDNHLSYVATTPADIAICFKFDSVRALSKKLSGIQANDPYVSPCLRTLTQMKHVLDDNFPKFDSLSNYLVLFTICEVGIINVIVPFSYRPSLPEVVSSCKKEGTKCCYNCGNALRESSSPVITCSRCEIAKYCNRDCKKGDYKTHKKICCCR